MNKEQHGAGIGNGATKQKCKECQFEDGDHSQGCSKYEDKPFSIPEGNGKASGGLSILKYPKLSVPEKEEAATPTVQHSMKCPKLYGETCTCTPQKEEKLPNCDETCVTHGHLFAKPPKEEGWEDRFDSLVYHNEPSGWGGQDAVRCVNAEHLGDVVSKLLPKVKDFIHQEIAQTKSTTRRESYQQGWNDCAKEVMSKLDKGINLNKQ